MRIIKLLVTGLFCTMCLPCNSQDSKPQNDLGGFAVVELFTSEGCSSCPAAEAVLARIHNEYKQGVFVMEYHVDYWNYLGWKDVYSSPLFTQRQQHYASLFGLSSTYTPQAIVTGKAEMVGSEDGKLHDKINTFLKQKATQTIQLSVKAGDGNIEVSYEAPNAHNEVLNIALVQEKAETNVRRGENSGKKLAHVNVVRSLTTIDLVKSNGVLTVALPAGLSAADVTVIAYAQNKDSWEVMGVAGMSIGR